MPLTEPLLPDQADEASARELVRPVRRGSSRRKEWDVSDDDLADLARIRTNFTQAQPSAQPEEKPLGFLGTVKQGAIGTLRTLGATADTMQGDAEGVVKAAQDQAAAPKDPDLERFYAHIDEQKQALGENPSLWEGIKAVGGAAIDNPRGFGLMVAEQLPNSAAALGAAGAGALAGSLAGPAGAVVGGIAGLAGANIGLETGAKALEAGQDGQFTSEEQSRVRREGLVKGATITGVDALTLGATKWITGTTKRAVEHATAKTLTDRGVDITSDAARKAAMETPEIADAVKAAQTLAKDGANKLGSRLARGGGAVALETVGEGAGEYLGELAATGKANAVDAVVEGFAGLGTSIGEISATAAMNRKGLQKLFGTQAEAEKTAEAQTKETGVEHEVIPNPTEPEKFSAVPKARSVGGIQLERDAQGNLKPVQPTSTETEFNLANKPAFDQTAEALIRRHAEDSAREEAYAANPIVIPGGSASNKEATIAGKPVTELSNEALTYTANRGGEKAKQRAIAEIDRRSRDTEAQKILAPERPTEAVKRIVATGVEKAQEDGKKASALPVAAAQVVAPTASVTPTVKQSLTVAPSPQVVLPDNTSLPAKWEVVDADTIKATMKQGQNQPRDRSRAASNVQVQGIANAPDYRRLADSPVMDVGAPTISHDGAIVGGNGRFEGVSRAYDQGTATAYRDQLKADAAAKGIDPAVIDGMKKPVLVKRITTPFDVRKLAIDSNSGTGLQYSGLELAKIDAERMKDLHHLDIDDSGDVSLTGSNIQNIRHALGGYGAAELGGLVDKDGRLSQEGTRRIRNAILYAAYGSNPTLERLVESTDNDLRNISGALVKAAGSAAKAREAIKAGTLPAQLDISAEIVGAVETLAKIKSQGSNVDEYLAQNGLFGEEINDDTKEILYVLEKNIRSQKKIADFIRAYYDSVSRIDTSSADIFGDAPPTKKELLKNAKDTITDKGTPTKDLFSKPAPSPSPKSPAQPANNAGTESGGSKDKVIPAPVPVASKEVGSASRTNGDAAIDQIKGNSAAEGLNQKTAPDRLAAPGKPIDHIAAPGKPIDHIAAPGKKVEPDHIVDANKKVDHPLRPLLESLIKKRAAAIQSGKGRSINTQIDRAKEVMAGTRKDATLESRWFRSQASAMKRADPATADILSKISDELKGKPSEKKPAFSRAQPKKQTLATENVKSVVDTITAKWKNAPDVIIIDSITDAPEAVRAENDKQLSMGATGEPEGFIHNGKVYIVAGQMNSPADVVRTILHESFGHFGLRGVLRNDLKAVLKQVAALRSKDIAAKAKQYGLDISKEENRLIAAEELLSEMAQNNPKSGIVQRAIAIIRSWLRRNIPGMANLKLSDAEIIEDFLIPARRFVQNGSKASDQTGTMFSRSPAAALSSAKASIKGTADKAIDSLIFNYQDRFKPLKDIQERTGPVAEDQDAALAEERYSGTVRARQDNFEETLVDPLLKAIHNSKVSFEDVEEYLHARHAPERNAAMREINPTAPELESQKAAAEKQRESLAKDQNVKNYVAKRREVRDAKADIEDGIADESLGRMLDNELAAIKKEQSVKDYIKSVDKLRGLNAIKPFEGDNTALSGMSNAESKAILAKIDSNGTKKALDEISNIIDTITSDTQKIYTDYGLEKPEAIAAWKEKYKNYVPLHRDEVSGNSMPRVGQGFNIKGKESKRATGSTKEVTHILAHVVAQHEAAIIRSEKAKVDQTLFKFAQANPDPNLWTLDNAPMMRTVDPVSGVVVDRVDPTYKNRDEVLTLKIDGEEHTITFNDKNLEAMRLAASMKNLGADQLGEVTKLVGKFTRFLAMMNTTANPVFVVRNFLRDLQTAFINLSDTELAAKKKEVFKAVPAAIRGMWDLSHGRHSSKWAKEAAAYKAAGGQVGWMEHYKDIGERAANIKKDLENMGPGKMKSAHRTLTALWKVISDANNAIENGVRLAAFVAARDGGMSPGKSAQLSKNLTVNFNTRGAKSVQLNMWYMFMNASVQGTARLVKALSNKQVQKIVAGVVVSGFLMDILARSLAGDDDSDGENDYDQLPEHVKAMNFVIWAGGQPITIPMPYGYNFFASAGRKVSEAIFREDYSPVKSGADLAAVFIDAFNPTGQAGSFLQFAAPTIADPFVQWAENKNFAGNPMRRSQNPFGVPKPEYQMGFKSTTAPAQWLAEKLNDVTGGNEVRPGFVNVNPAFFDFAVSSIAGGAGRTTMQAASLPIKTLSGDDIQAREVPFLNVFASARPEYQTERKYFDAVRNVELARSELKTYAQKGDSEMVKQIREEHGGELRLSESAKVTKKLLATLRKRELRLDKEQPENKRELKKQIEERKREIMSRFNKRYREATAP